VDATGVFGLVFATEKKKTWKNIKAAMVETSSSSCLVVGIHAHGSGLAI